MHKTNFNDFAKKVILALKTLELDLSQCQFSNIDWCEFLLDELEDEESLDEINMRHEISQHEKMATAWDEE